MLRLLLIFFLCIVGERRAVGFDAPFEKAVAALEKAKDTLTKKYDKSVLPQVVKYGGAAAFMASALMDTVFIIRSFLPGNKDSKDLKYLKEQFAVVNTKLDTLDHDFADVKSLIDWNALKINMGAYEANINALSQSFQVFLDAPIQSKPVYEDAYKMSYDYNFNDAHLKMYNILASENSIFHGDIFAVVSKYFKHDIRRVAEFSACMLRIIQKGIYLEAGYLLLKDQLAAFTEQQTAWKERFAKLAKIAAKVDETVKDKWSSQYRIDADEFSSRNSNLDNKAMATGVYDMLMDKYPWRQWFVLVYTFTNNNDKDRYYDNCGGFSKVNVGNKVVIVNSLSPEKKKPRINLYNFFSVIDGIEGMWPLHEVIAKRLYNMVTSSCDFYTFKGVFEAKATVIIKGPKHHYVKDRTKVMRPFKSMKKYYMIVFD